MDLGESRGGLPPDHVVEDLDAILASTESVIARHHDGERVVVTVAPCSPFSVTPELMRESAALARRHGLRLHTHLAETVDEERDVLERFGRRPVDLLDELGWIDDDVWVAHGIHFDDAEVARLGAAGTGSAHCPSSNARLGAGMCRVVDLESAGAPVGLGVDGVASNEVGGLQPELRQALYTARQRAGRADAFLPPDALRLATEGGARCLGRGRPRQARARSRADLVVWPGDDLGDVPDPLAGLRPRARPPGAARVRRGRAGRAGQDAARRGRTRPPARLWPNAPAGSGPDAAAEPCHPARRAGRRTRSRSRVRQPWVPARRARPDPPAVPTAGDGSRAVSGSAAGTGSRWCSPAVSPSCSSSTRRRRSRPGTARARSAAARTTSGSARSGASSTRARSAPTRSTHSSTPSGSSRGRAATACTRPTWRISPTARSSFAPTRRSSCSVPSCFDGRRRATWNASLDARTERDHPHHPAVARRGPARRLAPRDPAVPSVGGRGPSRPGVTSRQGVCSRSRRYTARELMS